MGTSPALTARIGASWNTVHPGQAHPLTYLPCELCGTSSAEVRSHLTDGLTLRRDATYVRCRRCGLVYQNPRPASYGGIRTLSPSGSLLRSLQGPARLLRWWLRRPQDVTALALGCGDGRILRLLADQGWKAVGIEPGLAQSRKGREAVQGLCVLPGPVESCRLAEESLDGAIAADSLAFLPNPAATLLELHRALKPLGRVLVTTPNADGAAFAWLGWDWPCVTPGATLFCLNLQTLTVLLEENGFRPVLSRQIPDGEAWLEGARRRLAARGWSRLSKLASDANPLARLAAWGASRIAALLRRGDRILILAEKR